MYAYTPVDQTLVDERVAQFQDQLRRYMEGTLSEEEFRPLRLQNGLYVQRYAPMLRIAVPYGQINSTQLRKIAEISRTYDRGYAHISTRQNIQLNWPELTQCGEILAELASVQMHAIQTSGNCIRNTTTDEYAGRVPGEVADPRPTCELIRQWSTFHPEFAFLPRKFKIAVSALPEVDRAATAFHDIGVFLVEQGGEIGYKIMVGGGLGRTPMIGSVIREFLPKADLISYLEAVLRVYNLHGRRDNKYKARIKILVKALTPKVFAQKVEAEFAKSILPAIDAGVMPRLEAVFADPDYQDLSDADLSEALSDPAFKRWYAHNTQAHKQPGYRIVTVSLKRKGIAPGDVDERELDLLADLADQYSFGELRTTHTQNIVLADVEQSKLYELWQVLDRENLARAHIGFITDMITCPGGDFCSLANAKSIPVAEAIMRRFDDLDAVYELGELSFNISGCMNACGHHHVGNIGVLGVDKKGDEFFQITLGGHADHDAELGKVVGPSFDADDVPDVVDEILNTYLDLRDSGERFIDTYRRVGIDPFKARIYPEKA